MILKNEARYTVVPGEGGVLNKFLYGEATPRLPWLQGSVLKIPIMK